jgi:hypothetical protein
VNSLRFGGLLLLFLASGAAQALTSEHDLLLDFDGQPNTGCTVSTPDGPFEGVEVIVSTTVETDGLSAADVTAVTRRECVDPATDSFGAPVNTGGGWPVGVGDGLAGFHAIETSASVPDAFRYHGTRIGVVASNELGDSATLLEINGGPIYLRGLPPLPVPVATGVALFALALVLLSLGLFVLGRRGRLTMVSMVMLLGAGVAAAGAAYSGALADWTANDLLAETSASDPEGGVDVRAVFGQRGGDGLTALFRLDSALVFAAPPVPQADSYTTQLTDPINEGEATGLLANDDRGLPAADLVSFGGGDLSGSVADNAAGATVAVGADGSITVNADGSFDFQAESGFDGEFSFDYRIENVAGTADATVTIDVQRPPTAVDDAFDVLAGESLDTGSGALLANDTGWPAPAVSAFGGGDLGGAVDDNAAGDSVTVGADGSLTVNADGQVVFTPATGFTGDFVFDYRIDNPAGTDTASVTVTVNESATITSADSATCSVGSACDFAFTADGYPDPTITVAGALPAGVTFNAGTESLEGTPQASSGAVYTLTVTAANGIGSDAEQTFTLTVNEPPTITSANTLSCEVGASCGFTFTADGHPDPTFSLPGLPAGLSLDASTGVLSGQPDAGTGGEYNLVLEASNSEGNDTQNFTLTVGQPPEITSPASLTCETGQACSLTLAADGFPAPGFSVAGTLPAGMTFDGTDTISGTPQAGSGAEYSLTVTAANGIAPDDVQTLTLTVNEAPTITSADAATCRTGQACSVQFTADGYPAPGFSLTGTLPAGVSFDSGTGALSGTPAAGAGGEYVLDLTAANGIAPDASQTFTLTVEQPPTITSGASQTCDVGLPCGFTFTADGYPAPAITLGGALPAGVTFDGTDTLAGTPQAGAGGQYALTVTAANGVTPDATQNFTLTVNEAPTAADDPTGGIPSGSSPGSTPYHGSFETALSVSAADGVLANDTLGFPQATITTPNPAAANGSVSLAGDGGFVYTPDAGFTGLDSFQYCIENVTTDSCATVTVAIGERPAANDDTYPATLVGNVAVDTTRSSGYSVLDLAAGDNLTLALDATSNGDASLNGDGTFEFNPAPGFSGGNATLTYSVGNGFGTVTGTVTLPVGADRVWFADNSAAAGGDGRFETPFDTLAALGAAADQAGDVLFLHAGSGDYTGGIALADGQFLIGEAATAPIATIAGLSLPADSVLPATAGAQPTIANAGGSGVSLAADNLLRGFALGDTSGAGIDGTAFGTLSASELDIVGSGVALSLTGGVANATFGTLSSNSASGNAVDLVNVGGAIDLGTGALAGMSGSALRVSGGTAGIDYAGDLQKSSPGRFLDIGARSSGNIGLTGNLSCTGSCGGIAAGGAAVEIRNVNGGTLTFSGANKTIQPASPAGGLHLVDNSGATIDIDGNLGVTTNGGAGISATGGGTLDMDIPSLSLQAVGAPALSVDGMTLVGQFASGALLVDSGALGAGVFAVSIANAQLPSGFTIGTNLAIDLDDSGESGGGVSLTNNTGRMAFTQWNRVNTNTTSALAASNAGTLEISPTSAGAAGTFDGTAVSISNTDLGSTGVTLTEVYNTNARGIVLENVTGAGGFSVTGTGSPVTVGSGGTLTGSPDNAVRLVNARNVSLGGMIVSNTGSHGIYGTGLSASTPGSGGNAFTFHDGEINAAGDGNDENAIHFGDGPDIDNVSDAVTLHNVVFDGYAENALHLANHTVAADVSVTDSVLRNAATTTNSNGLLLQSLTGATASFDLTATGNTFGQPFGGNSICCTGVTYNAQGSGIHSLVAQNNVFQNMSRAGGGQGLLVATTETGEMSVDISNNQFIDLDGANVGLSPLEDSTMTGTIVGNTFTAPNIQGAGINIVGDGEEGSIPTSSGSFTGVFAITNNTIGTTANRLTTGIRLLSRDTSNPNGRMDFTVADNTVHSMGSGSETVTVNSLDSATLCADVSNNTVSTDAGSLFDDIGLLQQGASTMNIAQASVGDVAAVNGGATVFTAGSQNFSASCNQP